MYRLFYNHESVGDVLFVVLCPDRYPDRVENKGEVVALYQGDDLVGINLFDFGKTCKIKASGMIVAPEDILIDIINDKLVNAGLEKLPYCRDTGFTVGEITNLEEHPLDEHSHIVTLKVKEKTLTTVSRYQNLEIGSKIVVVTDGAMKFDGTQFKAKVVKNIPIECEVCCEKDLHIGDEFKLAFIPEGKEAGQDFFLD